MQPNTNRKSWSIEEDQTIKRLVQIHGIQDWTQISNKLSQQYPSSKRSGKQCRQRWYNHLSPIISKNPWTLEEEDKLFRLHREQGNKWKDISKEFPGRQFTRLFRTDNDLKNHFYSTLRKSLRRLNKSLGEKNSTSQMREIKPSVLSKIMNHIYDGESQTNLLDCLKGIFLFNEDVPTLIFQFANIKPTKSGFTLKDDEMREKVLKIFGLISQFNDQYERVKNHKKQKATNKKQKADKITIINDQQYESFSENGIDCSSSGQNQNIESILDSENFIEKNDNIHEHTEDSMEHSSVSSPFSHLILSHHEDFHENFHLLLIPPKSGIFDDHDELMRADFQDPEQPSMINECVFSETNYGRNTFHKAVEHQEYCTRIVDELLDSNFR